WWIEGRPELEEFQDDSYGGPESVVKIHAGSDGCRIRITLNRLCELQNTFRVIGEKASMEGGIFSWKQVTLERKPGNPEVKKLRSPARNYPGFVLPIVENFIQVIRGNQPPLVSGRDVLPSIEFIHKCYESRRHVDLLWDRDVTLPSSGSRKRGQKKQKRILVTGAAGFIGCRVVELLHLANKSNYQVVAGIRQWSSAARLGRLPVEIVTMDLMDRAQVKQALENITHVIHCAKGTPEVTVDGTRNLLDASLEKGIQHLLHLSTADVYGNATGMVDERVPLQYTGNAYNRMKIDAEKVCQDFMERGLPMTVFRPSIVYGPYSTAWCLRFASLMLKGEWGIFEKYGEGKCNLLYVDDLVKTLISALDNEATFCRVLNVNGPEIITWNDYFTRLNDAMGLPSLEVIPARQADVSTYVMDPVRMLGGFVKKHFLRPMKLLAETSEAIDRLLRRVEHNVKARPASDELKLYARNVVYSDAKARKLLSYCAENRVDDGIGKSTDWLIYLGLVR
ncbi:MAG: NAD-dependent epimerase/dehydratase family protein, partial [Desulfomonilia bacterium]|nr:NAD-dependent epimerase/dehydratase family protein [Desulfomonilia bacterium]